VDTLLIYAKNRDPIFLQTFHHVGAPIVWHLSYVYGCDGGGFFASLGNSFVHSFMYAYYALVLCKVNAIHRYKIYLTSLQLAQLALGGFLMHINYNTVSESQECRAVITLFNGYICALIYLFVDFMVSTYGWRAIQSLLGGKAHNNVVSE
jgi:elongation of very long chain fatty acids protein 4